MQLSLYCFRPSHALASIGRYDFRMVQDAFQKPEAEILQRSTKMTNRGIIYTLYNGLKKDTRGYCAYRSYFPSFLRGSERYLHQN